MELDQDGLQAQRTACYRGVLQIETMCIFLVNFDKLECAADGILQLFSSLGTVT